MKIGIAFSGGGSRGFAHIGALKALNELGVKPHEVSGTSAGSIVASMTAAGYSPDEIFEIIQSANIVGHLKLAFNKLGLFKLEKAESIFLKYLPHNSFEALKIPLTVCAVDIENGMPEYFSSGELVKPILASCCLPGIFEPIKFNNKTYIDGGVLNNLPIEPLEASCDFIIGVNVTPTSKSMPINSAKDVLMKCLYMAINQASDEKLKRCDIGIEPEEIYQFNGLNTAKAKEIFRLGYEKTLKVAEGKLANVL